jgi:hypothetical protein
LLRTTLVLGAVVLFLSGCWDMKSIQDTNYVAALGFDFQDGKYVVYAQLLDFSNVSKPDFSKGGAAEMCGRARRRASPSSTR